MSRKQTRKTVQELEEPVVNLEVNPDTVDTEPDVVRPMGREYPKARSRMPEKQLFEFAEYHAQDAERIGYSNYSYWKSVWQNFLKNKAAVVMGIVFILLFIFTFVASAIGKYDIYMSPDPLNRAYISPNGEYWFGTNGIGQDYWAQVWGYVRKLDRFFTELYNLIDNIPTIIYMTLIALMVGKSMLTMGIAMVGFGWLGTARNVRNLVFMYRDREYNLASRCLGTRLGRILFRNIFPYLVSVIILRLALAIPGTIAYETTLTYLGLMDIMVPSLGNLLSAARAIFPRASYTLPGGERVLGCL